MRALQVEGMVPVRLLLPRYLVGRKSMPPASESSWAAACGKFLVTGEGGWK